MTHPLSSDAISVFSLETTYVVFSLDSNYIVDVVMWPKFGNPSISMREVIIIL